MMEHPMSELELKERMKYDQIDLGSPPKSSRKSESVNTGQNNQRQQAKGGGKMLYLAVYATSGLTYPLVSVRHFGNDDSLNHSVIGNERKTVSIREEVQISPSGWRMDSWLSRVRRLQPLST